MVCFPPRARRCEVRPVSDFGLGELFELVVGERKIDGEPHRLRHVPRRVGENLNSVALRIPHVDEPGGAVGNRLVTDTAVLLEPVEHGLECRQRTDAKLQMTERQVHDRSLIV